MESLQKPPPWPFKGYLVFCNCIFSFYRSFESTTHKLDKVWEERSQALAGKTARQDCDALHRRTTEKSVYTKGLDILLCVSTKMLLLFSRKTKW